MRVLLNQNFSTGWSSTAGTVEPDPASGRPSVRLPAGWTGDVTFRFVPPGWYAGWTIGIGAAALLGLWLRRTPTAGVAR